MTERVLFGIGIIKESLPQGFFRLSGGEAAMGEQIHLYKFRNDNFRNKSKE